MGGVIESATTLVDKYDPVSRHLTGSKGLDIFGTGKRAKEKKESQERSDAQWSEYYKGDEPASATNAPDAKKAAMNNQLLQQGTRRKRYLLQQSTGQPPKAPSITQQTQSPTRNLLG